MQEVFREDPTKHQDVQETLKDTEKHMREAKRKGLDEIEEDIRQHEAPKN